MLTLLFDTHLPPPLDLSPVSSFNSPVTYLHLPKEWVQDTAVATATWGDIGDWDVSEVLDFSHAFSPRVSVGDNPKAATFVGTAISKWITTSAENLYEMFREAGEMNADLSGWTVAKVTNLQSTFRGASKFAGTGLESWDTNSVNDLYKTFNDANAMNVDLGKWSVAKVTRLQQTFQGASKFRGVGLASWNIAKVTEGYMDKTFTSATSITSCNKRQIADAWKSNSAFATWNTAWANDACPPLTDASFKQASLGT